MKGIRIFLKGGAVIDTICEKAGMKVNQSTGKLTELTLEGQRGECINYINVHEVAAITAFEVEMEGK